MPKGDPEVYKMAQEKVTKGVALLQEIQGT